MLKAGPSLSKMYFTHLGFKHSEKKTIEKTFKI